MDGRPERYLRRGGGRRSVAASPSLSLSRVDTSSILLLITTSSASPRPSSALRHSLSLCQTSLSNFHSASSSLLILDISSNSSR
ncbi:hypothetical protein CRUP_026546, partial [Coryphaenoides rupestris]